MSRSPGFAVQVLNEDEADAKNSRYNEPEASTGDQRLIAQLRDSQRSSIELEIKLLEEIRRVQAASLDLMSTSTQREGQHLAELRRLSSINDVFEQTLANEVKFLRQEKEALRTDLDMVREQYAALKAAQDVLVVQATQEVKTDNAALNDQLRALVKHLHTTDDLRASRDAERDGEIKAYKEKIATLKKSNKLLSAQLDEANAERANLEAAGLRYQSQHSLGELQGSLPAHNSDPEIDEGAGALGRDLSTSVKPNLVDAELAERLEWVAGSHLFDADWYRTQYADYLKPSDNPLAHYLEIGFKLGHEPGPRFDSARYLRQNPDVAVVGEDPLYHFVRYGLAEAREAWPRTEAGPSLKDSS